MGEWLCDREVNRVLRVMARNAEDAVYFDDMRSLADTKHTLLFNSFYFESLKTRGMRSIREWMEAVSTDVLTRVLFPIFASSHWSACVMYPGIGTCVVFDSLIPSHMEAASVLLLHPGINLVIYDTMCAQQQDADSCGVFALYYLACLLKNKTGCIYKKVPVEKIRKKISRIHNG